MLGPAVKIAMEIEDLKSGHHPTVMLLLGCCWCKSSCHHKLMLLVGTWLEVVPSFVGEDAGLWLVVVVLFGFL